MSRNFEICGMASKPLCRSSKMTKEPGYVEAGNILKPIVDRLGHIMLDEIDVDRLLEKGGPDE